MSGQRQEDGCWHTNFASKALTDDNNNEPAASSSVKKCNRMMSSAMLSSAKVGVY